MRGNVIDMSIGVIIGTSFAAIVQSFVSDVLMPPIGLLIGQVDFSHLYISLTGEHFTSLSAAKEAGAPTLNYGMFINHVIHFVIVAFVLFLFVRQMNRLRSPKDDPFENMKSKQCHYCYSSIPFRATRCPNCTSLLETNEEDQDNERNKPILVKIRKRG